MRKCWLTTVSEQRIGRRSGEVALTVVLPAAVQTYMRARAPVMPTPVTPNGCVATYETH